MHVFSLFVLGLGNRIRKSIKSLVARELSSISPYFDHLIELFPPKHSDQQILKKIESDSKFTVTQLEQLEPLVNQDSNDLILLDGVFNYHSDIQQLLREMKRFLNRGSRLFVLAYNPYFKWLYQLANFLGLRNAELPTTFLTKTDLHNLTQLSGYSIIYIKGVVYSPFAFFGVGYFINGIFSLIPLIKEFSFIQIIMLRPEISEPHSLRLSIVIPARNEKGNIENAVQRLQSWNKNQLELIFVEGHSSDGTWEEILRVKERYDDQFDIKAFKQSGKGKSDAVRLGFEQAAGDLLTILDADLTVAPEFLERFYDAYHDGIGDFINGNRLLYAMEKDAMRFLNRLGNIFFAKALSVVLDTHIGDSLCGTKMFSKRDYQRFKKWRKIFGDFDPFGDFELLFPAALLGLEIVNVPVPYRARTYGSTNISRFRDGLMLLKMTAIGLFKIRMNLFPPKGEIHK